MRWSTDLKVARGRVMNDGLNGSPNAAQSRVKPESGSEENVVPL